MLTREDMVIIEYSVITVVSNTIQQKQHLV